MSRIAQRWLSTLISSTAKHEHRASSTNFCRLSPRTAKLMTANNSTGAVLAAHAMSKTITAETVNPNIKKMEYAVRGPVAIRAAEIEGELSQGVKKPFDEVIRANIGDCHACGQRPITFIRQVLAICAYPDLLNDNRFATDVKDRARRVLEGCKGHSVGSYSESMGIEAIRRDVADYIKRRDGHETNYEDVSLCAGASEGIRAVMKLLNYSKNQATRPPGIMIPIPQYPLYTASIAEYGFHPINYYLDESNNWALDIRELERAVDEARKQCEPRALVVINPGNPTGQVLSKDNIREIIKFAHRERLFLFADEVYQHNVYAAGSEFHSFRKILKELGPPYDSMELASFMSTSKGYMGECGLRGGYAEVINLDADVRALFAKSLSAKLCPTVLGQAALETVVNPPRPGEPSFDLFNKEVEAVLSELKSRATMVADAFNAIPGMKCNVVQGAMYAFPQVLLPPKAVKAANAAGVEPDLFYAMKLLDDAGICVVPGSGFGQIPGTYHFRTTILPQTDKLRSMVKLFGEFQRKFLKQYE